MLEKNIIVSKLYDLKLLTCPIYQLSDAENAFKNFMNNIKNKKLIHFNKHLSAVDKDKNGIPISKIYYTKSKNTLISARTIMQELSKFLIDNDIGRIAVKKEIENLEDYENLGVHHHMGGTRIGDNLNNSVVDTNLKVHDTKNLYIAGSSVFKSTGYSNPTYTIVQLSLRLSDEIIKRLI